MKNLNLAQLADTYLNLTTFHSLKEASPAELNEALSKAALSVIHENWEKSRKLHNNQKKACYFSAEFLMGRAIQNNLFAMGVLDETSEGVQLLGSNMNLLEDVEDDALGNGGLGRLAACFLDSAATMNLPLDGYGIRYKYGLFKQYFKDGHQMEIPDDWQKFKDPWSIRREEESVLVSFGDGMVRAVPYDMPIIGYGTDHIGTLRLWQAESPDGFNFDLFNQQKYAKAAKPQNDAEAICAVLYPNDDTNAGKKLRLKQQYFFSSASLQDLIREYKKHHKNFLDFGKWYAIQLNDTHPTVSIAELLRLLDMEGVDFETAFQIGMETFAYTNHTIMAEALETWDLRLFRTVLPEVYPFVKKLDEKLIHELTDKGVAKEDLVKYRIISGGRIHMARMAVFATHAINGVAEIHSRLLKTKVLKEWYDLYPERFQNKTNGITQRRWLGLCNPKLAAFITQRIGNGWLTDLSELQKLRAYLEDANSLREFADIKLACKEELCRVIEQKEGVRLDPHFVFDIQIKRLHEYKRQLLNAFSILDIYFRLKDGSLTEFQPTVFLFGAKSAPGYARAKGIILYLNRIAELVNSDPDTKDRLQVLFVQNYNVSYAEKLIPATDLSEQISTAGTEASGTGNMKQMLNGAPTLGTYDGANIEIVEQAGEDVNYIFGNRVEDLEKLKKTYDPKTIYEKDTRIRKVMDTLIDGTFDDNGSGIFKELYTALLEGASWHVPDHYYLLADFHSYVDTKVRAINDTANELDFARKGLANVAAAGKFSSDRTIAQYASEIWNIHPVF